MLFTPYRHRISSAVAGTLNRGPAAPPVAVPTFIAGGQALNGVPAISGLVQDGDIIIAVVSKVFTNTATGGAGAWGVTSAGLTPVLEYAESGFNTVAGSSILTAIKSGALTAFTAPTITPPADANPSFDNYVFGYGAFRDGTATLDQTAANHVASGTTLTTSVVAGGIGISTYLRRGSAATPTADPGDFTTFSTLATGSNTDISFAAGYVLPSGSGVPTAGSWGSSSAVIVRLAASFEAVP